MPHIYWVQNLRVWAEEGAKLQEQALLQKEKGERMLDEARELLPEISQSVETLRMYHDTLRLARRQIELEREFGLGALRALCGGGRDDGRTGKARGSSRVSGQRLHLASPPLASRQGHATTGNFALEVSTAAAGSVVQWGCIVGGTVMNE